MVTLYDRRQGLIWHALRVLEIISPNPWFLIKNLWLPSCCAETEKYCNFFISLTGIYMMMFLLFFLQSKQWRNRGKPRAVCVWFAWKLITNVFQVDSKSVMKSSISACRVVNQNRMKCMEKIPSSLNPWKANRCLWDTAQSVCKGVTEVILTWCCGYCGYHFLKSFV